MSRHHREIGRIVEQIALIREIVESSSGELDRRVESVSRWSVRQQLDHACKVLALGHKSFDGPRVAQPRGINLLGRTLLALGWLPRGRARSPKAVLPEETATAALAAEAVRLRAAYADPALAASPMFQDPTPTFPHPYFGGLTAAQGVRMLAVHTHHHLKIVRDIRRAAS